MGPGAAASLQSREAPGRILYARAIIGDISWNPSVFPYRLGGDDQERDDGDSARFMPKCVVVDNSFDWEGDRSLRRELHETVVYEAHLKGFTKRHPGIPESIRGTYAGLAHPVALEYLTTLGITAVERLPIHQFVHEQLRQQLEHASSVLAHAGGTRFDLASTLARELYEVDRLSAFFDIIHQDPTLSGVKLIAEPWDIGQGGYQVGNFPVRWCGWNGRY